MATKTKTLTTVKAAEVKKSSELTPDDKARLALMPSLNSAAVIHSYQGNLMGKDVDMHLMIDHLRTTFTEVKDGDLHTMEAMLISQATALQTIFTSLARRAQEQEYQKNLEAFLGLALKAQAQSRATISALVDLKYPRQATFVKQANIANGPQQVNNAAPVAPARENQSEQSKLLEAKTHERPYLDIGATPAAKRGDQTVEAVGKIHRAKKPRG
jgi:hypothetical protein